MSDLARYFQKPNTSADVMPLSIANTGGQQIGNAIAQAGRDITSAANALDEVKRRDEAFWVEKTVADIDTQTEADWTEQSNAANEGAPGFEQRFVGTLEQRVSAGRANAPSKRAARMFEERVLGLKTRKQQRAQAFETGQKYEYRKRTILGQADNFGQQAMRENGVPAWSPLGSLVPPGTLESSAAGAGVKDFYTAGPEAVTGHNIPDWSSKYYSPRDFADGKDMSDRSGAIIISKGMVAKLDWVTEQFGMGKLQINSGYRSPSSNVKRAKSGWKGPHTHGNSVDIQVRDLSQDEKNRLYSLLKAQGFNAFGFGQGALHAEIREGTGKGRNGDFEWTYNGVDKYQLVPVAGGSSAGGDWGTINQYPYLAMAGLTARSETAKHNLVEASAVIADDAGGSRSYGIFGINSGGTMQRFLDSNRDLGLTGRVGSPEFDEQWKHLAKTNPQKLITAQLKFHEKEVVRPARNSLVTADLGKFSNDPRAVAFVSDMVVQYGKGGVAKHLAAAAGAATVEQMVEAVSDSMRDSLDSDFRTSLAGNPNNRNGLLNRIERRAKDSLGLGSNSGASITGNVPAWSGPAPDIKDVPGYGDFMDRITKMIETMGGTPAQRAAVRQHMENQITRAWLQSVAERNPSAAMAALHSGKYDDALTITDESSLTNGAEAGWHKLEQNIRNSQKQLAINLKTETAQMVADEVASIAATGKSTGMLTDAHRGMMDDSDRENIALAQQQYQIGRDVATARAEDLPGILEQLEPEGEGFASEQKVYNYARDLIEARQKMQMTDPAGYAVSTNEKAAEGWRAAMEGKDSTAIQNAIRSIREVQKMQGVAPGDVRSLTQSSMAHNETLLKNPDNADVAFGNFMAMRDLYGSEFDNVLREMERDGGQKGWWAVNDIVKTGNVVLAKSLARVVHAGEFKDDARVGLRMAEAGQPGVARSIFDGRMKRLELKGIEPKGKSGDTDETVDQTVQSALGDTFAEVPAMASAVREAATSHYVNGSALGAELSSADLTASVNAVTGGILEHNGSDGSGRFLAPVAGMTQSQFNKALGTIKDSDLRGGFIGYSEVDEPVTADMLRNDLQLVSSGNGKYFLRYPGAGLARDKRGLPFEIDLGQMLPELASRTAEARRKAREDEKAQGLGGSAPVIPDPLSNFDPKTGLFQGAR